MGNVPSTFALVYIHVFLKMQSSDLFVFTRFSWVAEMIACIQVSYTLWSNVGHT